MGCDKPGCGQSVESTTRTLEICRVCELVDNDSGQKEVEYCEYCKNYICKHCATDWPKRAIAASIEWYLKHFNNV